MSTAADHTPLAKPPKTPAVPKPSASVLLISPTNQILLLHRVRTSSSFASAHVFPGGALSTTHDGPIPPPTSPDRHTDGPAYRLAAIRETFEESGILLARSKATGQFFTSTMVSDKELEEGRKAVHAGRVKFGELLERWGVEADTEGLRGLTRWITPENVPRRFSTMMYLYFLPIGSVSPSKKSDTTSTSSSSSSSSPSTSTSVGGEVGEGEGEPDIVIPHPTHDGGIEHTAARFLPPHKWISLARQNRIILFPPQFFLTLLLAPYLGTTITSPTSPIPSPEALQRERDSLISFLETPRSYQGEQEVSFADACISPVVLGKGEYGQKDQDGVGRGVDKHMAVLTLNWSGREVEGLGRRGLREWVVTTRFKGEGPRDVDVRRREEVLG
ncbi:hypothetical protein BCR34DRAFT_452992, partial [Clohesyomyces aquaticus]